MIIINFNGERIRYKGKGVLFLGLRSFSDMKYPNYKVIVVDNGSTDNSRELAKKFGADFVHIDKSRYTYNYARPSNVGIRYAQKKYDPDYFIILNDDVFANDKDWLGRLVGEAEREKADIVGCKLLYPDGRIQFAGFERSLTPTSRALDEKDTGQYSRTERVFSVVGVLMMISRNAVKKIGFFDEKFVMGFEDIDYCMRANKIGLKILYVGSVKLTHLLSFTDKATMKDKSKSSDTGKLRFYYWMRNLGYFMGKYPDLFSSGEKAKGIFYLTTTYLFTITGPDRKKSIFNLQARKPLSSISILPSAIADGLALKKKKEVYNPKYLP